MLRWGVDVCVCVCVCVELQMGEGCIDLGSSLGSIAS